MRTAQNKNIQDNLPSRDGSLSRTRRAYRVRRTNPLSIDLGTKANTILSQYNILRGNEEVNRTIQGSPQPLKVRNCSLRGTLNNLDDFRIELKKKAPQIDSLPNIATEGYFPSSTKSLQHGISLNRGRFKRESSNNSTRANMDTQTSLDRTLTRGSDEKVPNRVKNFLGRSIERNQPRESIAIGSLTNTNEVKGYEEANMKNRSFTYKMLDTTETDCAKRQVDDSEMQNIQKSLMKRRLKIIPRKPQQNKLDQILAQIPVFDKPNVTIQTEEDDFNKTTRTMNNFRATMKRTLYKTTRDFALNFSVKNVTYSEEISRMSINDIKKRLSEYGNTINKEISSYKDLSIFPDIQDQGSLKKDVERARRCIKIKNRVSVDEKRRAITAKFGETIIKLVRKMKLLGLTVDDVRIFLNYCLTLIFRL